MSLRNDRFGDRMCSGQWTLAQVPLHTIQHDGHSCGVYVCLVCEEHSKFSVKGKSIFLNTFNIIHNHDNVILIVIIHVIE